MPVDNNIITITSGWEAVTLKYQGVQVCQVRSWAAFAKFKEVKLIYDDEPQTSVKRYAQEFRSQIKTCKAYVDPKKIKIEVHYTNTLFGQEVVDGSYIQSNLTLLYQGQQKP